jgi:hypothetical protein
MRYRREGHMKVLPFGLVTRCIGLGKPVITGDRDPEGVK